MTDEELHDLLRRLANHLATLHEDLEEDALHAARQSQTGVRTGTTGSKLPCRATDLEYLVTDVAPRVQGWCQNLQDTARITGLPVGQPLNVWVAFLSRHRGALLEQDWADTAVDELGKLEEELRARLYPNDPEKITRPDMNTEARELPTLCTTDQLCSAYNVQPATIRKWKERKKIHPAGTQTLATGETLDLWRMRKPE